MKCEVCGCKEATKEIIIINANKRTSKKVCESCLTKYENHNIQDSYDDYIKDNVSTATIIKCPNCNLSLDDAIKNKEFGCEYCYIHFKDFIKHWSNGRKHNGKIPLRRENSLFDEISLVGINNKISEAIAMEDYKEADRLKGIREQILKKGDRQ